MTATVKQIRRGSAAENDAFTGAIGEVTMDTTNKTLRVHDGTTAGGTILARKNEIAYLSMPSKRYENLTLGASGTQYTAPADGWVYIRKRANASGQYIAMIKYLSNNSSYEAAVAWSHGNHDIYVNIPVYAGETFGVNYTASGTANGEFFRFIYANGAN